MWSFDAVHNTKGLTKIDGLMEKYRNNTVHMHKVYTKNIMISANDSHLRSATANLVHRQVTKKYNVTTQDPYSGPTEGFVIRKEYKRRMNEIYSGVCSQSIVNTMRRSYRMCQNLSTGMDIPLNLFRTSIHPQSFVNSHIWILGSCCYRVMF